MKTVLIFGHFTPIEKSIRRRTAWASCASQFDTELKECAEPYHFTERDVYNNYQGGYSSTDAPNVNLFVECLWRKWGFLSENGEINYNAIKTTKVPLVTLIGVCDDQPISSPTYITAYPDAVDQCEREAPSHVRAETIRSCILLRFRERLEVARKELRHS